MYTISMHCLLGYIYIYLVSNCSIRRNPKFIIGVHSLVTTLQILYSIVLHTAQISVVILCGPLESQVLIQLCLENILEQIQEGTIW